MTDPFARLGSFMYRFRWYVLGAWLVILGVCGAFAPKAVDVLQSGGIEAPGSDSSVASGLLAGEFNVSALNNVAIVLHSDTQTIDDDEFEQQVVDAGKRVRGVEGVTRVVTYYGTLLPTLVSEDEHTTIVFASLKGDEGEAQTYVEGVREALEETSLEHYVTGAAAVNHDFQETSEKDLKRAEVLTAGLVLLLLLFTFRTVVAAVVPLLLGAAAVISATAVLYLIGSLADTSIFALNIASMIGLGLAIDFSLIVVSRFREEFAKHKDPQLATAITMATAGRSIVYSGITVMLAMLVLTVMVDLMVIRSISLGVMLVAATALIAGVTLLPAVLGLLIIQAGAAAGDPEGQAQAGGTGVLVPVQPRRHAPAVGLAVRVARDHRRPRLAGTRDEAARRDAEAAARRGRVGQGRRHPQRGVRREPAVTDPDRRDDAGRRCLHAEVPRRPGPADELAGCRPARCLGHVAGDVHGRRAARRALVAHHGQARLRAGAGHLQPGRGRGDSGRLPREHDRRLGRRGPAQPRLLRLRTVQLPERRQPRAPGHADVPGLPRQHGQPEGPGARSGQALAQRRLRRSRQGPGRRRRHGGHARPRRSADRPAADGSDAAAPTRRPR